MKQGPGHGWWRPVRVWALGCVAAWWAGAMGPAWGQEAAPAGGRQAPAAAQAMGPEKPSAAQLMQKNGGSLLRASLMAAPDPAKAKVSVVSYVSVPEPTPKTLKKHDLVTIIIREQSEYSSDGSTELKKKTDFDLRLEEWVKLDPRNFEIEGGALGANPPSIKLGGARNYKGEATVDRTDKLVTRIAAEVVDVKPNGTLAIQARKRIKHDEEEQEYLLTGICRAEDLSPDNTILSTNVHDLNIETTHKGAVRDNTKRGLIPKLLDVINPF